MLLSQSFPVFLAFAFAFAFAFAEYPYLFLALVNTCDYFFKLGEMLFPFHVFHLGNTNTEITFETLSGNLMARKQGKSER